MSSVVGVDVGATHTLMCVLGEEGPRFPAPLLTGDYPTALGLLETALGDTRPAAVCVAVAGPVLNGTARLTNGALNFDGAALKRALALPAFALANDLVALATEAPHLDLTRLMLLGGAWAEGPRAVLAPGTGLGMAIIDAAGQVAPSEGGHAPLAPGDALELELLAALSEAHGYVAWETVLSGPGLVNLYRAMCQVWGSAPETLKPVQVAERAMTVADPVCHQTLETWCAMLGNAAGALCVTACATGGVYLGGGIPPRIADFIAASPFRRRFEERGQMSDYVRSIATALIADETTGAAGAARCAARLIAGGSARQ